MIDYDSYVYVLLSVAAGLLTLLGSVGIFVSLIIQRRVERLQDILEEFMDLSYNEDINLTGKMFKLIEKYQMHYLAPGKPSNIILSYINGTIFVVILVWSSALFVDFKAATKALTFIYALPLMSGLALLIFYRYLIRNALNPVKNSFLSPIIPPPTKLRSISYLSKYINISVKSILKQARLRLLIKKAPNNSGLILLKEELSFDDFFYYLVLSSEEKTYFVGYGELKMVFSHEPITNKPIPAARNINIPLGELIWAELPQEPLNGNLLIFPRGEKHPISYIFNLNNQTDFFMVTGDPEVSINYLVTYRIKKDLLEILNLQVPLPYFEELAPHFTLNQKRWACPIGQGQLLKAMLIEQDIYID